jgi:hypothetical protein
LELTASRPRPTAIKREEITTMDHAAGPVRLSPELQAEYQQVYNDPRRKGSDAWFVAAKGLFAAGLITESPGDQAGLDETLSVADSRTDQQSL